MRNLGLTAAPPNIKSPDDLVATPLASAYREWRALAGRRFAPQRREITPSRFKAVLKDAFLLDVVDGGADFRFALGGERITRFLSDRLAPGALLSETAGTLFHERAMRAYRHCIETRAPFAAGPWQSVLEGREHLTIETLVLPLSEDGAVVSGIFGAVHTEPVQSAALPVTAKMVTAFSSSDAA